MNQPEPPITPESTTPISHRDGILYLREGSELPTDTCICSGRKSVKVVSKALRNPRRPTTWFSRQPCISIGLCKKHLDDNNVGIALTLSVLVIGIAIFVAGIITLEAWSLVIGLLAILVSGIFRARGPIYCVDTSAEPLAIKGAHQSFLQQFPEREAELGES